MKKIKETLMAAALSLAFSDCRNDASCSMALDNLDAEGFTMATV